MKITKAELKELIKESVTKFQKKTILENRLKEIKAELDSLNENEAIMPTAEEEPKTEEKSESIFDSKPGETVILNFEGVTLKIERQLDDLFKVVDAAESKKLKDGDYVKIQGNDTLEAGKNFKFIIYRETPLKYETNPLNSWKIIKN
jgi:predicted component of viral defense system (DUF524 family)